jgi:hypothetical protein
VKKNLVSLLLPFALLVFGLLLGSPVHAQAPEEPVDPVVASAREHFMRGVELVKAAQWAEALAEFEKSSTLRPHPITTFNEGACQRALGRYTLARESLRRALGPSDGRTELPEMHAADAKAFLEEIERTLVHVTMTVKPGGSRMSVDGRPVQPGEGGVFVAGVSPPGPGAPAPSGRFELLLDPGAHVFSFARKGYADAVVNRPFSAGERAVLDFELDLLPATLTVSANVSGAIVAIGAREVGPVPVDVRRAPGGYRVTVRKDGYEPYEASVMLKPGEQTSLRARLSPEKVPITKRWWFWTGAAAVVTGGVLATYALTREDPPPEPYDGGSTGWVVMP